MENKKYFTNKQNQPIDYTCSGLYHWNGEALKWELDQSDFEWERRGLIKFFNEAMIHELS